MTKQQFIETLDRRLQIIDEKERKDIIDEYCNHIDMRIAEGKSEEEAIADFGDMDELITDILDAYKIDTKKMKEDNFENKVNRFLDDLFDGLKRWISHLTSLDMDGVVHLLFELFVTLIILFFLRIPFEIIAGLGSNLLDGIFGFSIGSLFGGLWHLIVMLLFAVLCCVVIVNIFFKRISHYRQAEMDDRTIIDDLKESFSFEEAKENINKMGAENKTSQTTSYEDINHKQPYDSKDDQAMNRSRQSGGTSSVSIVLKVFGVLLMIPIISVIIGLSILLSILVMCSIKGFTLIGAYLIVIGLIIGAGAFCDLISRSIFKGGK